jgi:hypothetical protein
MSTGRQDFEPGLELARPLSKAAAMERRPYDTPRLTVLGDLRQLTLGGSGPLPESGGSRQFPPGPRPPG